MDNEQVTIALGPGEGEASIKRMMKMLRTSLQVQEKDTLDHRIIRALIDTMPGFVRALERERNIYNVRRRAGDKDVLDNYLQVLTLPVVNMIGSIVMTLAPTDLHLRGALVENIFDNIVRGVCSEVCDGGAVNGRGH